MIINCTDDTERGSKMLIINGTDYTESYLRHALVHLSTQKWGLPYSHGIEDIHNFPLTPSSANNVLGTVCCYAALLKESLFQDSDRKYSMGGHSTTQWETNRSEARANSKQISTRAKSRQQVQILLTQIPAMPVSKFKNKKRKGI